MKLVSLAVFFVQFLIISLNSALAQDIHWSEDFKVKYFINDVININENEYYSWTTYGTFATLSHFSDSKCDGESGKIELTKKRQNMLRNDCFSIGENIVFVYSVLEKKEVRTYARKFGKDCMPLSEPILLNSIACNAKRNLNELVNASQSPNKRFIAISSRKNDEWPEFINKVYDDQLNLVEEKKTQLKYPSYKLVWDRFIVTDLGEMIFGFYYLFSTTQGQYMVEIQKGNSSDNITYNILENHPISLSYDPERSQLKLIEKFYLKESENELILSGLVIDFLNSIKKTEIYQTFSKDILLEGFSKKELEDFEGKNSVIELLSEIGHYNFNRVFSSPDGGNVIVMEANYQSASTFSSANGMEQTSIIYLSQGMLILKLDNENNLAWIKKVPKSQMAGRLDHFKLGSYCFSRNNELVILFNDNKKGYLEDGTFDTSQEVSLLQEGLINEVCLAKVKIDLTSGSMERTKWIQGNDSYAMPKGFNYNPLNSVLLLNYYRMSHQKFGLVGL